MDYSVKAIKLLNYIHEKNAIKLNNIRKKLAAYINYIDFISHLDFIKNCPNAWENNEDYVNEFAINKFIRDRIIHTHIIKEYRRFSKLELNNYYENNVNLFINDDLTIYGLINYISSFLPDEMKYLLASDLGLIYNYDGIKDSHDIKKFNEIKLITKFYIELDDLCVKNGKHKDHRYYKIEDAKEILKVGGTIFHEIKEIRDLYFHGTLAEITDEDLISRFLVMIDNIKNKTTNSDVIFLCEGIINQYKK